MQKAKWIWTDKNNSENSYANFFCDFTAAPAKDVKLDISCDSDYAVYINGKLAAFGQYPDFPYYKVYDSVDITKFTVKGKNRVAVCAYYCGRELMSYYKGDAGIIFEVTQNGDVLSYSGEGTKCRKAVDYVSGEKTLITSQLGFSYAYDMSLYDGWDKKDFDISKIGNGVIIDKTYDIKPRPIKKTVLGDRINSAMIKAGSFEYKGGETDAEKQQLAKISYDAYVDGNKISVKKGGVYALFDLGREEAGFLNISVNTEKPVKISIGYGEHIEDGRVRSYIGGRNFAVSIISGKGNGEFLNTFRRLGGRYLQVFAETASIGINFVTVRPVYYPLNINKFEDKNALRQKIYDISVRTLHLCMHDHYEDTPWREQCFYTMDSRNQMLCGYYAFGETEFAGACLKLTGMDKTEDNLLSICYPSHIDLKIPSFSLYYIIQMNEYIKYSSDISIAKEFYGKMQSVLKVFTDRMENGLVPAFTKKEHWNFYEWADGLSGNLFEPSVKETDLILNCLLSLALLNMAEISNTLGNKKDEAGYQSLSRGINEAVNGAFFDGTLYETTKGSGHYCELGNSLAILCGAAGKYAEQIAKILAGGDNGLVKATLSMLCFKYDALIKTNKDRYAGVILDEMDKNYSYMISRGATSFWETIKGAGDFDNAGSLCHGWSAVPVYYYNILKEYLYQE